MRRLHFDLSGIPAEFARTTAAAATTTSLRLIVVLPMWGRSPDMPEAMASPDAGDACSLSEAAALLCDADTDGDGQVSYEEFHALMTRGLRSPTKSKSVALLGA